MLNGISSHWRSALKPALPWLTLVTLLNAWALRSQLVSASTPPELTLNWIDLAAAAVGLIAGSSIAVTWHQFILRDVPLASVPVFRLDGTVWRYLGRIISIVAICFLPLLALMVALEFAPLLLMPLILALLIQLAVFGYRMSLTLPAVALGDKTLSIKQALEITRGNNLRILALICLTVLLLMVGLILFVSLVGVLKTAAPVAAQIVVIILGIPVLFFNTLLTSNLLTSLYGFFVERRDF